MDNKNISFNHTLEEYNKKYRNRNHRLLKFTKKEVEDFDKKNPTGIKNYLLKDRKWWLIKDTYYEIPIAPRATWFRNLSAGAQVATCVLGAGVLATAVVVPTVLLLNKDGTVNREVSVDEAIEHVKCESKMVDGNLEITLKPDTGYKVTGIKEIKINTYKLQDNEYKYENSKVTIAKEVLDAHTGKVIVTPKIEKHIPVFDSIEIVKNPNKWIYVVGEKFSSAGLKIVGVKGTEKIDITSECNIDIEEGHEFTDEEKIEEKEIKVTYKEKEASFKIAVNDKYEEYLDFSDETNGIIKKKDGATMPKYLSIPEKLNGIDVKQINQNGFFGDGKIEAVDFTNSKVNKIYMQAFFMCSKLKKVIIGNEINAIGGATGEGGDMGNVFYNCSSLEEIIFLNTSKINFNASKGGMHFGGCNIKTIAIDSKEFADVASTEEDYFDQTLYENLEAIYIKSGIELSQDSYISKNFTKAKSSDRYGYDKYNAPEFVYGSYTSEEPFTCAIKAGKGFQSKDVVTLPEFDTTGKYKVTHFLGNAFSGKKCETLIFSKYITVIDCSSFQGAEIKNIVLNDGIQDIGDCMFSFSKIEQINIPKSLSDTMDDAAFAQCNYLKTVIIDSQSVALCTKNCGGMFNKAETVYTHKDLTQPKTAGQYIFDNFDNQGLSTEKPNYIKWTKKAG